MKVGWLAGWGVDPDSLWAEVNRWFAGPEHQVLLPQKSEKEDFADFDKIVGWSWGAFRLAESFLANPTDQEPGRIALVAGFAGFCREDHLGGACSRTQVRYLRRWLSREPRVALEDFASRSGVNLPIAESTSPLYPFWADQLGAMETQKLDPGLFREKVDRGEFQLWVGDRDPLLDSGLCQDLLGATLVRGAGHDLADYRVLLKKFLEC